MIRIGIGYDVHQLVEGNLFTLGGIVIPHTKGSEGHSDADVLLHALCDALLGALNLRDIGYHFPDTDSAYKGINSKILLNKVYEMVKERNYFIGNIDSTICLQKPKIAEHIQSMKESISKTLNIPQEKISIKATTTEKLGFVGREEGVSASVVVLVMKSEDRL